MSDSALQLATPQEPVARSGLLDRLSGLLDSLHTGRSHSCLLLGPTGIGKSWLLRACHQRWSGRTLCAWGYGDAAPGAPALWPFIEILRALQVEGHTLHCRDELKAILSPWVLGGKMTSSAAEEAPARRFLLSEEIVSLLLAAAGQGPLCLIFEDVHMLDPTSLGTLSRLLNRAHEAPLLILASMRDPHPIAEGSIVPELPAAFEQRWTLPGLTRHEVRQWLSAELGSSVSETFCAELHERAEGNPLYVASVITRLARGESRGSLNALPRGLLLAATAQLDTLTAACRAAMRWAAVLGREFERDLWRKMVSDEDAEVYLQTAMRQGIVLATASPERLRFAHELLRDVLLSELSAAQSSCAHAAAEEVLAARRHGSVEDHSQRAFHALHTRTEAGYGRAAAHYAQLGQAAAQRGAQHEAAQAHLGAEQALLGLIELSAGARERDLQLKLAQQRLNRARALWFCGQHGQTRELCTQVTAIATQHGDPELQAQAALAALGTDLPVQLDPQQVILCEDALRAFAGHRTRTAMQLLVRLGTLLCLSDRWAEGRALIASARAECPPEYMAEVEPILVLAQFYALPDLASKAERWALIARGQEIVEARKDRNAAMWVRLWEIRWHMEHGKLSTVHALCRAHLQTTDRFGDPLPRWNARMALSAYAMRAGELDRAMQLAEQAREVGRGAGGPNVDIAFLAQQLSVDLLRGRLETVVDVLQLGAEQFPHLVDFRATLAAVRAELSHWSAAHLNYIRACEALSANEFGAATVHALCQLAQAAFWLAQAPADTHGYGPEARAHAERLRAHLGPLAERWVVIGQLQACCGPVTYYLGLLELSLDNPSAAQRHLRGALEQSRIQGAMVWVAHAHWALARCLSGNQGAVSQCNDGAREHAEQALRLALGMDLQALVRHSRGLLAELSRAPTLPNVAPAPRQPVRAQFLRKGEVWHIRFAEQAALFSDLKGMHYLERLLATPSQSVHVLELLQTCGDFSPGQEGAFVAELQVAGRLDLPLPTLDATATHAYRAHARELSEAIAEAERMQDLGRQQRLRAEQQLLHEQLLEAQRVKHPPTERARKAVYNRIRTAIRHIEGDHPRLGQHLSTSIKTGTHCCYNPERKHIWEIGTSAMDRC